MKKKYIAAALLLGMSLSLFACGKKAEPEVPAEPEIVEEVVEEESEEEPEVEEVIEEEPEVIEEEEIVEEEEEDIIPEGMYRNELSGELIDLEIQNQRPIAVMVDNESLALPHYGVNSSDIIYEMMNSTKNGRITRLMCIVKDWQSLTQFGSVRSARPTNFMVCSEYNAVLCHDGGPYYNDYYIAKDYTNNFSGGFTRVSNGKSREYTEYIQYSDTSASTDGLKEKFEKSKYTTDYNEFYEGPHFTFSPKEISLAEEFGAAEVRDIILPFPHNNSELHYVEEDGTYEYSEYGKKHIDALDDSVTAFKNVILQCCSHAQLDENGYLVYNVIGQGEGFYITDGYSIPVVWFKTSENGITGFYNKATGEPITLNVGKTYIGIVPEDVWGDLELN